MKRAFEVEQKVFFIIFEGLSVATNCLLPESAPLKSRFLLTKELPFHSTTVKVILCDM